MRSLLLVLLLFSLSYAQGEVTVGDHGVTVGIPLDAKMIDVGFKSFRAFNVSTVNSANHLLMRWSKPTDKQVKGYAVRVGYPKCRITSKAFGLVSFDSLMVRNECLNFVSPVEVQEETSYLLKVSGFDIVFQVLALDGNGGIVATSQIRYVRQKR